MAYRSNPMDSAKGRSGSNYGQAEMEVSKADSTVRVKMNSTTRSVGNPLGAGVNTSKTNRGVVAPWDDKASYNMEDLVGRA